MLASCREAQTLLHRARGPPVGVGNMWMVGPLSLQLLLDDGTREFVFQLYFLLNNSDWIMGLLNLYFSCPGNACGSPRETWCSA